jgi:hypothetical protein
MNFKTTAILLVLLLGIGGYVFFTRDKGASTDTTATPTPPAAKPLLDLKSADVTAITIDGSDGKPVLALEKANGNWRLTAPVKAAADKYSADSLVDAVTTDLKPTSLVKASGPDAPQTGIDHPQYTVELTAGEKSAKLVVGDRLGVGDGVYAQAGGSGDVAVVPASLLETLARPASDLRNKQLFGTTTSADVQQLTLTHRDGTKIELQKLAGAWKIVGPTPTAADTTAVEDLLSTVISLSPVSFVDDPVGAMGLKKPSAVVSFSTLAPATQPSTKPTTGPAPTVVTFGSYDGVQRTNVFAALSDGTTFKVAASTLDSLNKTPLDLRDKSVVDVDPAKVKSVTIAIETTATTQPTTKPAVTKTIVLTRRPPKPVVMGPVLPATKPTTRATTGPTSAPAPAPPTVWTVDGTDADDAKVTALLAQFHPLKADKFLAASAITNPARRFTVTFVTGAGVPVVVHVDEPGHDLPLVGMAAGATFNLPTGNTLATDLSAEMKK